LRDSFASLESHIENLLLLSNFVIDISVLVSTVRNVETSKPKKCAKKVKTLAAFITFVG